ncbi:MAG TPA: hypothetical protein VGR42_16275 [Casimicrobiaceae bacterium]|nr:hypothetical protein [Casimicrobiaceae bacterium]
MLGCCEQHRTPYPCVAERSHRRGQGAESLSGQSQVVMRTCVGRPKSRRALEAAQSFVQPSLLLSKIAEIVDRVEIIGLQAQRLLKAGSRAVRVVERSACFAQVVERCGARRIEIERFLDQLDGLGVIAALMRGDAQQVQRVEVAGIHLQYLAVHTDRLRQASCLMVLQADRDRVGCGNGLPGAHAKKRVACG